MPTFDSGDISDLEDAVGDIYQGIWDFLVLVGPVLFLVLAGVLGIRLILSLFYNRSRS